MHLSIISIEFIVDGQRSYDTVLQRHDGKGVGILGICDGFVQSLCTDTRKENAPDCPANVIRD